MDAIITVIVIVFIKIQTKAFFALPSCVCKMFAANIKEHNASQVYIKMFDTNGETTATIKTKPQPPCSPPALTACWSVRQSNQHLTPQQRLPPPPLFFPFQM